jgi:hypothetical protein
MSVGPDLESALWELDQAIGCTQSTLDKLLEELDPQDNRERKTQLKLQKALRLLEAVASDLRV